MFSVVLAIAALILSGISIGITICTLVLYAPALRKREDSGNGGHNSSKS